MSEQARREGGPITNEAIMVYSIPPPCQPRDRFPFKDSFRKSLARAEQSLVELHAKKGFITTADISMHAMLHCISVHVRDNIIDRLKKRHSVDVILEIEKPEEKRVGIVAALSILLFASVVANIAMFFTMISKR